MTITPVITAPYSGVIKTVPMGGRLALQTLRLRIFIIFAPNTSAEIITNLRLAGHNLATLIFFQLQKQKKHNRLQHR